MRTVLVIDDDAIVARHVQRSVDDHPALRCIGIARSLGEARQAIALLPDLIISDLGLPDGSGLSLIEQLRGSGDGYAPRILILSIYGDRESVMSALVAGADGYILKDADGPEVVRQALEVLDGGAPLSPSIATYVLRHLRVPQVDRPSEPGLLSPREIELLRLLAKGYSNKQAAKALALSPHTIGDYVKSIYRKLQVGSRSEAMLRAVEGGLLRP